MTKKTKGFTLMELMITVAIVGILAAIAIPSYNSYVLRGNRAVAKTVLAEVASRQESFFVDRKQYATVLGQTPPDNLGYPADTFFFDRQGIRTNAATPGTIYSVTLTAATATSYTVTATTQPGSQQAKDSCTTLSLDNRGNKTSTPAGVDCWTR